MPHALPLLDETIELAEILHPTWPALSRQLAEEGVPLNEGDEGGDTGTDGSAAGSEDGDGDGDGDSGEGSGADGDGDGDTSGSGAGDTDDDTVTMPKGEAERLRREVATAAREKRERERKAAEEAGDHQKVVQQVEQERDEAIQERDEAREELATFKAQGIVRQVADRLNFHDPEDAILRVPKDVAEKGEAAIEKHLRDLVKQKPHLVNEGSTRTGAGMNGGGGGGGGGGSTLTKEEVDAMSADEMKERFDEVQAYFASLNS